MIYQLADTAKAAHLFAGWEETLITSCLQNVMGAVYVTDQEAPASAMAFLGCFAFYAGRPDRELVLAKPAGFVIMTPENDSWSACIEECFPDAKKATRYAIRKDTVFDASHLQELVQRLPAGYTLREIDSSLYDLCLQDPATADFVSSFGKKETFLALGRGVVVLKDGQIISGASSYSRYREGIEIEVDTIEAERRKGLASAACAALILRCLQEGLYPSWDAQNQISVRLAEKLGYELDHEYTVYEVSGDRRTH
ncbi:MAG: GNAT family N-acetyltransferase [Oscillospiraceae bacterium]|nr:GNAT family N-acetyltransferase [Oscillospiraceae bacterium]